jgi:hypothetical protein
MTAKLARDEITLIRWNGIAGRADRHDPLLGALEMPG